MKYNPQNMIGVPSAYQDMITQHRGVFRHPLHAESGMPV